VLTVELSEDAVQIVLELLVCSDHEREPVHAFPFELLGRIDLALVAAPGGGTGGGQGKIEQKDVEQHRR